ncbi:MAG: phosphatase PAP2 family protein [Acidimicrobiales bacterium]
MFEDYPRHDRHAPPVASRHVQRAGRLPSMPMIELPPGVDRIDTAIDRWWERLRGHAALDRLYYGASEAADFSLLWHTLGVVQAIIEDDPMIAVTLSGALGIESALVNGPVKSLFGRHRPVHEGPRPHQLRRPRTSSFPSGHASAAMVAAALLSRHAGGTAWYGLAAIVATSRIHVRIHHASDVVGGVAVGAVLGAVARRVLS